MLLATLVGAYLLGVGISADDKWSRLYQPDVGFLADGRTLSPTRADAAAAGLRGGGLALRLNGQKVQGCVFADDAPLRTQVGQVNSLLVRKPDGSERQVDIEVRVWTGEDMLFAEGFTLLLSGLFFAVGVIAFALRPYTHGAWSLLAGCTLGGAALANLLAPPDPDRPLQTMFLIVARTLLSAVPFHLALAFPVAHRLLIQRQTAVSLI